MHALAMFEGGAPAPPETLPFTCHPPLRTSQYFKSASGVPITWFLNRIHIEQPINGEAGGRLKM